MIKSCFPDGTPDLFQNSSGRGFPPLAGAMPAPKVRYQSAPSGRSRSLSGLVIASVALVALSAVMAPAQSSKPANPLGTSSEVIGAGHLLYNKTCTGCHGIDGSQGEMAPPLGGSRRYFRVSEMAIFDTIKSGIPGTGMPALGLPDDDIWRIVTYIRSLRGAASDAPAPGNVAHGMTVFAGKGGCQQCHMIRGEGGAIGPDLSNVGSQLTLSRLRATLTQELPTPEGYAPVTVTTRKGEIVEGIAKNEDGFSIQILGKDNKLHLYEKDELRKISHGPKSLMPHDYDKILTADEFQDLLAMLSRQALTKGRIKAEGEGEIGR